MNLKSQRFVGLHLSGAKTNKTVISVLEYYPKEGKIFVLDVRDQLFEGNAHKKKNHTPDDVLLEELKKLSSRLCTLAVNVPLTLPPYFSPQKNSKTTAEWMNVYLQEKKEELDLGYLKSFTPYTQRPIEVFTRYSIFPKLDEKLWFDIDETLGGNKAPLTARMQFLKDELKEIPMIEVWPKLTLAILSMQMGLTSKSMQNYRKLEEGFEARKFILEKICDELGVFVYENDLKILSENLHCFDSFLCAYTAILHEMGKCELAPKNYPMDSGWLSFPEFSV